MHEILVHPYKSDIMVITCGAGDKCNNSDIQTDIEILYVPFELVWVCYRNCVEALICSY